MKLNKRNPRQEWLFEKAYCWLKSSNMDRNAAWYPHHAIRVAYTLFVSSGKFESFEKYLKHPSRRKQPPIDILFEAYKPVAKKSSSQRHFPLITTPCSSPPPLTSKQAIELGSNSLLTFGHRRWLKVLPCLVLMVAWYFAWNG